MSATKPHIAVLDPGQNCPEVDAFNRLVQYHSSFEFSYHLPALTGLDSIHDLERSPQGVIVLGSAASVYDELDWQDDLRAYIQECFDSSLPCLGICYGHQLFAHMLGAPIGFVHESKEKLLGLRSFEVCDPKINFKGSRKGDLIVSHREMVLHLPDQCQLMGRCDSVPVEAFRHKSKPIWAIQAHPEAGPGFLRNQSIPVKHPEGAYEFGQNLIANFLEICR